jgi:hypothetical protein
MKFDTLLDSLEKQVRLVCSQQARYRILWVVGKPRSGKTPLCRALCSRTGWKYINFTLDPDFLESLIGREETYRPEDFLGILKLVCNDTAAEIVVLDEIEPLLGWWTLQQQEVFFKQVGRATNLQTGVVVITRKRTKLELGNILPDMSQNHIFEMPEGVQL